MAKSVSVQLPLTEVDVSAKGGFVLHDVANDHLAEIASLSSTRSKQSLIPFPKDYRKPNSASRARDVLLAVSHDVQSVLSRQSIETPGVRHSVRLKIEPTPPALMVSGSTGSLRTSQDLRTQTSPQPGQVTVKPVSAFKTFRNMTGMPAKQRSDTVKTFATGRNMMNRLMLQTAKAQQRADTLYQLRSKVEDQRSTTQYRITVRLKERKDTMEEFTERRKMLKTTSDQDLKRREFVESQHQNRLKTTIKEKRVPARSLLYVNSLDPEAIPPVREPTFTLNDLQLLLSTAQPKRFRFK